MIRWFFLFFLLLIQSAYSYQYCIQCQIPHNDEIYSCRGAASFGDYFDSYSDFDWIFPATSQEARAEVKYFAGLFVTLSQTPVQHYWGEMKKWFGVNGQEGSEFEHAVRYDAHRSRYVSGRPAVIQVGSDESIPHCKRISCHGLRQDRQQMCILHME